MSFKPKGPSSPRLTDKEVIDRTARSLSEGKAVGWMQGRMEFGPRALGNRSILGDPRSPMMQKMLNLKVKYRESFRPFAPSVLREDVADWFDLPCDSPYMLLVANVRKERRRAMTKDEQALFGIDKLNVPRSDIPAVTHVDYSARVQTVHRATNPRYHALLSRFKELTGCPVLVNTSFNVRGEPIVCSISDAFRCFMGTDIETLVISNAFSKTGAESSAQAGLQKRIRTGLIDIALMGEQHVSICLAHTGLSARRWEACPGPYHSSHSECLMPPAGFSARGGGRASAPILGPACMITRDVHRFFGSCRRNLTQHGTAIGRSLWSVIKTARFKWALQWGTWFLLAIFTAALSLEFGLWTESESFRGPFKADPNAAQSYVLQLGGFGLADMLLDNNRGR